MPEQAPSCPACGADVSQLVQLAEQAYLDRLSATTPLPPPQDVLVPRLGEFLTEQGVLTRQQLDQALARQTELASQGRHALLGEVLLELGLLEHDVLDGAVTSQIGELHRALRQAKTQLERRVVTRTAELRLALERLTELDQVKTNLMSNVSHELRTPLTQIAGYLRLLMARQLGPIPGEQQPALEAMDRAVARLARLIESFIEQAEAARGGLSLSLESVDLLELAGSVVGNCQAKARKKGVTLQLDHEIPVAPVQADTQRLGWAIQELVENGLKFTPAGGQVTLTLEELEGQVAVSVVDTGSGIPEDRLAEIFTPFHQLDGSASRIAGGTGIGLALAQSILEAHGASLEVTSQVGKGTTFRFALDLPPQ